MTWNYIWKLLMKGYRIRRSGWFGYWAWENGTIMIHEADGNVLDIRETQDPEFTFGNMAADDWVICGDELNENEIRAKLGEIHKLEEELSLLGCRVKVRFY